MNQVMVYMALILAVVVFAYAQADDQMQKAGRPIEPLAVGPNYKNGICLSNGVIKVGFNDFGAFGVNAGGSPCGFQYPIGAEHLAAFWLGEGYFIAYGATSFYFYPSDGGPDPLPDTPPMLATASETVEGLTFTTVKSEYVTKDGRLQVSHVLYLPQGKKWAIIKATLKALNPVTGLYYKRVVDWDVFSTPPNDYWGRDDFRGYPELIVAYEGSVYVGVASYPVFDIYDLDAWDDRYIVGVGGSHVTASLSSPVQGDFNVGLHFLLGNLNAGDSRSLCFIYVAGGSLSELERNFNDAETYAELICGKKVVGSENKLSK
ncbi:MAG: hypothetical protein ACPL3C_12655 [Pyrobaculum sp.]